MKTYTLVMRLLPFFLACNLIASTPQVTVVVIVDQMAQHLFARHKQFFRGGIKTLLDNGLYFTNASYPHAQPETATGHAALSTGAYGKHHGLIANEWLDSTCKKINACDEMDKERGRVFATSEKRGKSARALRAPTLAASCILAPQPANVITLSLKSRAAIPLAGPLGLAVWFDTKNGQFTSSTAFCTELPAWVRAFNKHLDITLKQQATTTWNPCYPLDHTAYQHAHPSYDFAGNAFSLIRQPQPFFDEKKNETSYHLFEQTPQASQELIRLARLTLNQHLQKNPDRPLVLMVSLSNLDYAGHYYGPYSYETIDILLSIDRQLDLFINETNTLMGEDNVLWALTADHGSMPIPELLREQGGIPAKRLDATLIMQELNRLIYETYNVKDLFITSLPPHFYFDMSKWEEEHTDTQKAIIATTLDYLHAIEGIEHAWYKDELASPSFLTQHPVGSRERWFANQYFDGRSGDFIVQVKPYVELTNYPKGTGHDSPYDYDIKVPLVLSRPGTIEPETNDQPVSMLQFAATMAHLLNVERPAMALSGILPGVR